MDMSFIAVFEKDMGLKLTTTELLLFSLIQSLDTPATQCFASISYFAKRCNSCERHITRCLNSLRDKGLIEIETRVGDTHIIRVVREKKTEQSDSTPDTPTAKPKTSRKPKAEFVPPTYEEWEKYCLSRGLRVDIAKKSYDYYKQRDWFKANGQKIDNWKGTIIAVWEKPENKSKGGTTMFGDKEIPL